jgi:hypothetical protein
MNDEPRTLEETLDAWSVDYLEAAIALHAIVHEAMKSTGYRHIGKAIAQLELPKQTEPWQPQVYASRKPNTED